MKCYRNINQQYFFCFWYFTAVAYLNCFFQGEASNSVPFSHALSRSFSDFSSSSPSVFYLGHAEHLALPRSLVLLLPDRVTVSGSESLTAFSSWVSMFSTRHLIAASILVFSYDRQETQIRMCFGFRAYYTATSACSKTHQPTVNTTHSYTYRRKTIQAISYIM